MTQRAKRPRDTNQFSKFIVDVATGAAKDIMPVRATDHPISEIGRIDGSKGRRASAKTLTAEERCQIAAHAARAR